MKNVYLLYGYVDRFDFDGEPTSEGILLAIYSDRETAKAAIFDWERKTSKFDSFDIENWCVQ